jgi:hypothetical protein
MRQQVLERRVELLKMEGSGFSTIDIVKHLSQKYGVSERQLYYDYEKRKIWQTMIQQLADPEALMLKIINRYEQIYQKASFIQLQADNDNARIGALRTMLEANHALHLTITPEATISEPLPEPPGTPKYSEEEKQVLDKACRIIKQHRYEPRESIH